MKGAELLGYRVKDKITNFEGVATGAAQYISGCNQILVAPPLGADGGIRESHWFDEQRLLLMPSVDRIELDNGTNPGCDKQAPKR